MHAMPTAARGWMEPAGHAASVCIAGVHRAAAKGLHSWRPVLTAHAVTEPILSACLCSWA